MKPTIPAMRRFLLLLFALLVTLLALSLRLRAAGQLGIDYDEDDYLAAGQRYAAAMRQGDLPAIIDYDFNFEHPPLTKLVYGLAILPLPEVPLLPERPSTDSPRKFMPFSQFRTGRLTAVTFGALEAGALALLNPVAGLFLAIHTWQIKYTSQIMLEPLPALTSLLAVLFYVRARRRWNRWMLVSAAMLGLTAAGKYTYAIVGLAMLADWLWASAPGDWRKPAHWRRWLAPALAWGLFSLLIFFAFNPRLWNDPLGRLSQSLFFHGDYAQSQHVKDAGYPAWQPLVWLSMSVPWQSEVFLLQLDFGITLLAVIGMRRLWQRQRVFALWFGIGLIFLLFWPTKWPQYILTITAPLSLAAAEGLGLLLLDPLKSWFGQLRQRLSGARPISQESPPTLRESLRALPWLLPGLIALSLIALYPLLFQAAMALTDFNAMSIRDGMQGGVWREVWLGLSGQVQSVSFDIFRGARSLQVHYAGPSVLLGLLSGGALDLLLFNLFWTVTTVGLQTALGVSAAMLLHQRGLRLRRWWQAILILPWAIPEFVGALVWLRLFDNHGGWALLAAQAQPGISLPSPLQNPAQALPILLTAATWLGFPFIMVAALAGLKMVPEEVYDAAAMDGAGGWKLFRSITWPLLLPLLTPMVIIRGIFAFNQFYLFYTLNTPYPLMSFATLSYWYFMPTSRFGGQFGVSAAINIFTVIILIGLLLWFNRLSKAAEGVTYA